MKAVKILMAVFIALAFASVAFAQGVINLPQTGQTTSYAVGDDGEKKAGVSWPNPRFTVIYCDNNGPCANQSNDCDSNANNDVVTDNLTGLMWARNGNLPNEAMKWANALTYANNLILCGYNDWRLPNINELESLVHVGEGNPAAWLNTQGFNNVQSSIYWSSSTSADNTANAWSVIMWNGNVFSFYKVNTYYVWPVRAGQ